MSRAQWASAVYVAFRNQKGEYLLQRRANTGYMDGHYDLGATGHVEQNEAILDCALREAKEEIGVDVCIEDLKLIRVTQTNTYGNPYISFFFLCEKWQREPRICEPEKCDDLAWFAPDHFPERLTNGVRIIQLTKFRENFEFFCSDSETPL